MRTLQNQQLKEMMLQTGECSGITLLTTFLILAPLLFAIEYDVYSVQSSSVNGLFKKKGISHRQYFSEISAFKKTFHLYDIGMDYKHLKYNFHVCTIPDDCSERMSKK